MQALRLDERKAHLDPVAWRGGESLEALQEGVGGYVDVLELTASVSMWVNDEGAYRCHLNRAATKLASLVLGSEGGPAQDLLTDGVVPVFGPVVFTGGRDDDGEVRPLRPEAVEWLRAWAAGRPTSTRLLADLDEMPPTPHLGDVVRWEGTLWRVWSKCPPRLHLRPLGAENGARWVGIDEVTVHKARGVDEEGGGR